MLLGSGSGECDPIGAASSEDESPLISTGVLSSILLLRFINVDNKFLDKMRVYRTKSKDQGPADQQTTLIKIITKQNK